MRIIAGIYSSRRLKAPEGYDTRPTLDKVRGAVFSSLGGFFDGGTILDLYGGSGAVSLEAISRGFERAVICDKSKTAVSVIRENADALGVSESCRILQMSDMKALQMLAEEKAVFDLVYLDPPYEKQHNEDVIRYLEEHCMLRNGSRIVVECLKEDPMPDAVGNVSRYKRAEYGITAIVYYRFNEEES
ncbi:MAG: 16S rRNA (guanine(966)-N(2))-methyltransferase RsmD [Solobacterium sp.]|nr:16S rRNA (guanine(966)-N(2))-methyltransferase RsmD [Solobacterium sp.]